MRSIVTRILQRMKHAGETFSDPKMTICSDYITIVGFKCSYEGRKPTNDAIGKILCWRPCEDTTNIISKNSSAIQKLYTQLCDGGGTLI